MKKHKITVTAPPKGLEIFENYKKILKEVCIAMLDELSPGCPCVLEISFAGDEKMRELNLESRGIDRSTDVLSFPMLELAPDGGPLDPQAADLEDGRVYLGDIVIGLTRAAEQAEALGHSLERETAFLATHSVLHLFGHDHPEGGEPDSAARAMQERALEACGLGREKAGGPASGRCGTISILGRPNVGKSTLLNQIIGEKVAIVSPKPQTTRSRIMGVLTQDDCQYIFLDTPGLHRPQTRLGQRMVRSIYNSIADIDLALLMVAPDKPPGRPERMLIERIAKENIPCILVLNKSDSVDKAAMLPAIHAYSEAYAFKEIVPVSAREGDGVEGLLEIIKGYLPEQGFIYSDDTLTDQTERQIASETLREKLLRLLEDEVPHGIAVETAAFEEKPGLIKIEMNVYCDKESHKGIIIGKNGENLKKAGTMAREDLEKFFDTKVFLNIWVKTKKDWKNSDYLMHEFGFDDLNGL